MLKVFFFFGIFSLTFTMKDEENTPTASVAKTPESTESIQNAQIYFLKAIFVHGNRIGVQGDKAYLTFNMKATEANGYTACNIFSSPFQLKGKKLTFNRLNSSSQLCPDYLDGLESDYLEALGNVQNYTIDRDHNLVLMSHSDTLLILHE